MKSLKTNGDYYKNALYQHNKKKNCITSTLWVYIVSGRSTITKFLTSLSSEWFEKMDKNAPIYAINMDFRKYFDTEVLPNVR